LDTKWKVLDATAGDAREKYGLKQSDFYQMFAYGQRYLGGVGQMALVYPQHAGFAQPLPAFDFSPDLQLWVLPFDLERGLLVMPGSWQSHEARALPNQLLGEARMPVAI
jgi:5-methylcytosine-specific restriction enzyme subunit McrC